VNSPGKAANLNKGAAELQMLRLKTSISLRGAPGLAKVGLAALVTVISMALLSLSQENQSQNKPDIAKLRAAAESGDPAAQTALGLACQNGRGVEQNDALAVDWYRKAAAAGNSEAQNDLGVMYMNGWGVEKNKVEAVRWYRLAVKQKNAHAMFNLGAAYYNGDGVGIDDTRAYAWFLLAQDNGSESAADAVRRAEGQLGSITLNLGIDDLAEMYFKGDELPRDYKEGVRWLRKAAGRGDVHSQMVLAGMLMDGIGGLPPDYEEARQWCEAALKQRSAMGANCLGDIYRKGLGTPKDPTKALACCAKRLTQESYRQWRKQQICSLAVRRARRNNIRL
jgi:TPR repeat protein